MALCSEVAADLGDESWCARPDDHSFAELVQVSRADNWTGGKNHLVETSRSSLRKEKCCHLFVWRVCRFVAVTLEHMKAARRQCGSRLDWTTFDGEACDVGTRSDAVELE